MTIRHFVRQESGGLQRLKELLPVFFDLHQIYIIQTQRDILIQCNLIPIQEGTMVTFHPNAGVV
jgi:hypothetical protein